MKTRLGEENENAILNEIEPIILSWAKKTKLTPDEIKSSVIYLWEDAAEEKAQAYQDYLSSREIGPYGGR